MNNPTHIVISDDFIQEVQAWKNKYWFNGSQQALDEYKASLPKIQRADNSKWKKGQELRIDVDFEIKDAVFNVYTGFVCFVEVERDLDWAYHQVTPVAIPIEQQEQPKKYHAVEYAGYWAIKTEPYYDAGVDILNAEEVGPEQAEKNANLIVSLLNKEQSTPQEQQEGMPDFDDETININEELPFPKTISDS